MTPELFKAHTDAVQQHRASIETAFSAMSAAVNDLRDKVAGHTAAVDGIQIGLNAVNVSLVTLTNLVMALRGEVSALSQAVPKE